jgi:hypothetical protein
VAVPMRIKTFVVATVAASAAGVAVMAVPAAAAPAPAAEAAAAAVAAPVKRVECRANAGRRLVTDTGRTCSAVSERDGVRSSAVVKGNRAECIVTAGNVVIRSARTKAEGCRIRINQPGGPVVAIVRPA